MKGTSTFDTVPRWRMSFGLNGKNPSVLSVWNQLFHSSLLDMNTLALMEYVPKSIIQPYLRKIINKNSFSRVLWCILGAYMVGRTKTYFSRLKETDEKWESSYRKIGERGHHIVRAIFFQEILLSLFFYQCSHVSSFLVAKILVAKISRRQNTFMPVDVYSIVFVYLQKQNILLFVVVWPGNFDLFHCNIMLLGITWNAFDPVKEIWTDLLTKYLCFYLFNQTEQS